MHAVIFHDGLSSEFIRKYQNDKIKFLPIPEKNYNLSSMNDIRFMIYLDYVIENPTLQKIIISDIADVEFFTNVFTNINQNKLYVSYDRNRTFKHYYLTNRIKLTYRNPNMFDGLTNYKALQAGLFAGTRDIILACWVI